MNIDRVLTVASVLIGTIVSYYFYSVSIEKREPTAYISPERTSIVNSNLPELSDLTVLFKGNPIEQKNVTAIRMYLWNAGMLAIHKADIIENDRTIHIVFPENIQILKPLVLKASRDIINMKSLLCEGSQHDICVTFDILEHNDGAAIQIIYGGPSNAVPKISGTIEGAGLVKIQKSYSKIEDISFVDSITYFQLWYTLVFIISTSGIMFLLWLTYKETKANTIINGATSSRDLLKREVQILAMALALMVVVLVMTVFVGPKYVGLNNVPREISVPTSSP